MSYRKFVVACVTAVGLQACIPAPPVNTDPAVSNPFSGAWLITQTGVTDAYGATTVNDSPATGMFVFTQRHYSILFVPGAERAPCRFSREVTSAECLSAYDNFSADAGTYVYDETTLTAQNMIAKIPDVMKATAVFEWRLDGDALLLTLRGAWAPVGGQITYKLARLE